MGTDERDADGIAPIGASGADGRGSDNSLQTHRHQHLGAGAFVGPRPPHPGAPAPGSCANGAEAPPQAPGSTPRPGGDPPDDDRPLARDIACHPTRAILGDRQGRQWTRRLSRSDDSKRESWTRSWRRASAHGRRCIDQRGRPSSGLGRRGDRVTTGTGGTSALLQHQVGVAHLRADLGHLRRVGCLVAPDLAEDDRAGPRVEAEPGEVAVRG